VGLEDAGRRGDARRRLTRSLLDVAALTLHQVKSVAPGAHDDPFEDRTCRFLAPGARMAILDRRCSRREPRARSVRARRRRRDGRPPRTGRPRPRCSGRSGGDRPEPGATRAPIRVSPPPARSSLLPSARQASIGPRSIDRWVVGWTSGRIHAPVGCDPGSGWPADAGDRLTRARLVCICHKGTPRRRTTRPVVGVDVAEPVPAVNDVSVDHSQGGRWRTSRTCGNFRARGPLPDSRDTHGRMRPDAFSPGGPEIWRLVRRRR